MNRAFSILLLVAWLPGARADAQGSPGDPNASIRIEFGLDADRSAQLEWTGQQRIWVVPRDLDEQHQPVALMPEEWISRYQGMGRKVSARLRVVGPGPTGLHLAVERFDLSAWLGESELAPVGRERMQALTLSLGFDSRGPSGAIHLDDAARMDASSWAAVQPLAELLGSWVQLSFPRLPAQAVSPGDCWSHARSVLAAVPDVPSLSMQVWSFYLFAGVEPCDARRCARIEEVLQATVDGQRPLGDSLIGVWLEGVGVASYRIPLEPGAFGTAQGRLALEAEISSRPALGMPPDFVTRSRIESSWRRAQ